MIKATELRIGNWTLYLGEYKQITAISKGFFNVDDDCFEDDRGEFQTVLFGNGGFEPIPLTPEILLKAGFVNNGFKLSETHGIECIKGKLLLFSYRDIHEGDGLPLNIEFLHQLQNVHYSLTGVELDIKL